MHQAAVQHSRPNTSALRIARAANVGAKHLITTAYFHTKGMVILQ